VAIPVFLPSHLHKSYRVSALVSRFTQCVDFNTYAAFRPWLQPISLHTYISRVPFFFFFSDVTPRYEMAPPPNLSTYSSPSLPEFVDLNTPPASSLHTYRSRIPCLFLYFYYTTSLFLLFFSRFTQFVDLNTSTAFCLWLQPISL